MEITATCRNCGSKLPVRPETASVTLKCARCGTVAELRFSDGMREGRIVDECPVCEGKDFYSRKDFNPRKGLAIVAVAALISAAFYYAGKDLLAYAILATAVVLDLIIYQRLSEVTVCYRCQAEFRGRYQPSAPAFDLHKADVLEHEYRKRLKTSCGQNPESRIQNSE